MSENSGLLWHGRFRHWPTWMTVAMAAAAVTALLCSAPAGAAGVPARHGSAASVAAYLDGVACVSTDNCMAVGQYDVSPYSPIAEHWNGSKWAVVSTPRPSGTGGAVLTGVACPAAKSCIAAGHYYDSSTSATVPMAETWNGSKWSLVTVPAPSGSASAGLLAVACPGAKNCQAVGDNSSADETLAESWNGSAWSIVSSPSPNPGKPNELTGVACPSSTECWAVGYSFPTDYAGSLTERWNGSAWSVVTTPHFKSYQAIGDGCSGVSACLTVGISGKLFAFAQRWNGKTWALTAAPKKPTGELSSQLRAVACAGSSACEAVGQYTNSKADLPLAESWNGTKWTAQAAPGVSGSSFVTLSGIACPAARDCWAVGYYIVVGSSGSTDYPVIEHWNGSTWSLAS